jgi:hypothetical protein
MNAGYDFNDFELIESVFVASNTASVIFNNLNQYATEYKHLQIRYSMKNSDSLDNGIYSRFNSDSGANYAWHALAANGSATFSAASPNSSNLLAGLSSSSSNSTSIFSSGVIDLLDAFSLTKNKTLRVVSGVSGNAQTRIDLHSGFWNNLTSLSSWTIFPAANSMIAGSRFSLYGIR